MGRWDQGVPLGAFPWPCDLQMERGWVCCCYLQGGLLLTGTYINASTLSTIPGSVRVPIPMCLWPTCGVEGARGALWGHVWGEGGGKPTGFCTMTISALQRPHLLWVCHCPWVPPHPCALTGDTVGSR